MSNALAIAGVTAVLRDLLDTGLIDHKITDAMGQGVTVSAVAPDTIPIEGSSAKPQLNIFLHQVSANAGLRNLDLPTRDRNGDRVANTPLALDLHYLVTAYGTGDLQAEVLLGYAMQLFHETPMPPRSAIRTALNPPGASVDASLLPSVYQALRASDLAEQYEQIKITPAAMNTDEMSKLWSAIQAHYRPTAAYQVSVVLIQASRPGSAALPVLTRGPREDSAVDPAVKRERGVAVHSGIELPFPDIEAVVLPAARVAAHLGDTITLTGRNLDGSNHALLLSLPRLGIERTLSPASGVGPTSAGFLLPDEPDAIPAGSYLVAIRLQRPGDPMERTSGQLLLKVAPRITSLTMPPQVFIRDGEDTATISIGCTPEVRPEQRASLIVGNREVSAEPHATSTPNLVFKLPDAQAGTYYVRLRVDGVDSQLIDRAASPPKYLDQRIEIA